MSEYDITSPKNEYELGRQLRDKPLSDSSLQLVIQGPRDELSLRRGDGQKVVQAEFYVNQLDLNRPTAILGRVAIQGATERAARIDALGDDKNDKNNKLRLVVWDE